MVRARIKTFLDYMTYWLREAPRGIDFARNYYPYGADSANIWYERTQERHLRQIFSYFPDTGRAVLDLGCGKGCALYTLYRLGFRRLAGLEYTACLADVARRNMDILGLADEIGIMTGDAAAFRDYDAYDIIYMFHPFDESVMRHVVRAAEESLHRKPRAFTVVYFHPMVHLLWDRSRMFRRTAQMTMQYFNAELDVYYYEYDPNKMKEGDVRFRDVLTQAMKGRGQRG
jgi:predicted RNA methylase